jgi:hypothetical protein
MLQLTILWVSLSLCLVQGFMHPFASRNANESWKDARLRYYNTMTFANSNTDDKSVDDSQVPLSEADFTKIPSSEFQQIKEFFEKSRDLRFIADRDHKNFSRRITWLYPDDGCFARAGLLIQHAVDWKLILPWKIFVFGDLTLQTSNNPKGQVSWWFHVAPIIRSEDSKLWVLDPSVHPDAPVELDSWIDKLGDKNSVKVSVCTSFAYGVENSCENSTAADNSVALKNQMYFLYWEWQRQLTLGRVPENVLGDYPPWKNSTAIE